jgi:hypothetical protein
MPEATKVRTAVVMNFLSCHSVASGLSGAELERRIQGTESNARGEEKHARQHEKYDTQHSGDDAAEIQSGNNGGNDNADSAINIGHIF